MFGPPSEAFSSHSSNGTSVKCTSACPNDCAPLPHSNAHHILPLSAAHTHFPPRFLVVFSDVVGRSKGPVLFEFTFAFIGHSQYGYHWGTFSREEQTTWCQQRINLEPAITVFFILCCIYFARELDLHDHVILQALVAEPQNIHTHFQSRISWTCLFQPFIVRMIISFFEKDILGTYMADDA